MLPILLYITTVALLFLVVVQRAYEVALHPQNFHQIYEIPVINLYNQMRFPGTAASQPLTPPPQQSAAAPEDSQDLPIPGAPPTDEEYQHPKI